MSKLKNNTITEPLYLRYHLRMPHKIGTPLATAASEAYIKVHAIMCDLSYKMWINPPRITARLPAYFHYVMFVTIMISKEEEFNKVLFELALKYGVEARDKVAVVRLTEDQDDVEA